jgi:hypothetical protein
LRQGPARRTAIAGLSRSQRVVKHITGQTEERFLGADIWESEHGERKHRRAGVFHEPGRDIPVYDECDVLVVGGGPAGTAAALAAARTGAEVILMERYNHLGGLSTGGLVIWIDRMTDWTGRQVIKGFAEEVFDRLPPEAVAGPDRSDWGSQEPGKATYWGYRTAASHGIVTWSPTLDPEQLKILSQEMCLEAGVKLVLHSLGSYPIVENGVVKGAVFESKAGRQAVFAKVVVDCTGDGDMFARAGAEFESDIEEGDVHHCMNTAWMFGGVDMNKWIDFRNTESDQFADFMERGRAEVGPFERPFVSWRNDVALFLGPRQSGLSALDVDDIVEVEIRSHRLAWRHLEYFKKNAPGFEGAWLMVTAPQLGVRHTRRLAGVGRIERGQWDQGVPFADEVAVSPSVSPKFPVISVPYGSLVPRALDGLLAGGRHVSCDANSHGFMREIPQCWITGQAAGAAAALAANAGVQPRAVDIKALQKTLRAQGVFLQDQVAAKPETVGA